MKTPTMRLDRLLANLGYGSRREVGFMVAGGLVVRDGVRLRDPSERLPITADMPEHIRVGAAPIDPPAKRPNCSTPSTFQCQVVTSPNQRAPMLWRSSRAVTPPKVAWVLR